MKKGRKDRKKEGEREEGRKAGRGREGERWGGRRRQKGIDRKANTANWVPFYISQFQDFLERNDIKLPNKSVHVSLLLHTVPRTPTN